jgi:3-oxoacyl-(acyl-carrier-protein) synthase
MTPSHSAPAANGAGAAMCMQGIRRCWLTPSDIGYINAHGTSTTLNDKSETAAIKTVFSETAYQIPISSTKSMTGTCLALQVVSKPCFVFKSLQDNVLPPTINYETPDPECDLDYVPNQARQCQVQHIMSNFGFGV